MGPPQGARLDTISFHHWLRQQSPDEEACKNIGLFIAGGMLTKPAHSFSALQAVLMAASAGSFTHLTDEDFILDKGVIGGMQQVSLRIAAERGDDVVLNSPVRTINSIAGFLGEKALQPDVYYESDWGSEEWTRGAYASSYDLGGLHRYGKDQHTPVGPIYWSSSDLAAEGYQHVDGAVRTDKATAARIVAADAAVRGMVGSGVVV